MFNKAKKVIRRRSYRTNTSSRCNGCIQHTSRPISLQVSPATTTHFSAPPQLSVLICLTAETSCLPRLRDLQPSDRSPRCQGRSLRVSANDHNTPFCDVPECSAPRRIRLSVIDLPQTPGGRRGAGNDGGGDVSVVVDLNVFPLANCVFVGREVVFFCLVQHFERKHY